MAEEFEINKAAKVAAERSGLIEAMSKAMQTAELPDLKAIVCAFTRRAGGADGIARMLLREYRTAKEGSTIRAMILQMILQASKAVSAKNTPRDESMMSDADIDRAAAEIMQEVQTTDKYRRRKRVQKEGSTSGIDSGGSSGGTPGTVDGESPSASGRIEYLPTDASAGSLPHE